MLDTNRHNRLQFIGVPVIGKTYTYLNESYTFISMKTNMIGNFQINGNDIELFVLEYNSDLDYD